MQKFKLFLLIAFTAINNAFSQCPVAGFTVNQNVCLGDSFLVTNTTTGSASSFQWDFCAGDLDQTPPPATSSGPLALSNPDGIDYAYDGTNWYAFICQPGTNIIVRYLVGSSIDNPLTSPVILNVQNLSMNAPWDIEVIEDGTYWYALVNGGFSNRLYRLDLDSLNNDSPFGVDLNVNGLNFPFHSTAVKDGNNFVYLVANNGGNTITVVNFGPSLSNNAPGAANFGVTGGGGPRAIAVAKDCDTWYGLVSFAGDGTIQRVDFGDSLTQAPLSVTTLTTIVYGGTREIKLVNENCKWYAIIMDANGTALGRLSFGPDLSNNTTSFTDFGSLGLFNFDVEFTLEKEGSKYYGFTSGYFSNDVKKFIFPDSCSANISVSSDVNPSGIFYSNYGTYNISLSVTDSAGNTDFICNSINVVPPPIAGFATGPACVNQPVSFYDSSEVNIGTITNWLWEFGDGDSSLSENPVHTYSNATFYLVTLTVTSDAGCTATFTDTVFVEDAPNADFSVADSACAHSSVQFTDLSTASSGTVTAWEWNFGDNTPVDNSQNPQHVFDSTGTFTVQLVAFTSSGCSDTNVQSITIVPGPLADFTTAQTCVGETTLFTNNSTIAGGGTLTYEWDFGDLTTSIATNPSHLYALAAATYPVQLIATATNGCTDTLVKNIRISDRANPGFTYSPFTACAGSPLQFIDTSSVSAGDTISLVTWDFGDATPLQTGDTVIHTYTLANNYTIILTVTSLTSCDTTVSIPITVIQCPVTQCPIAGFNLPDSACGSSLSIINTTIAGTNYEWDFCAGDVERTPLFSDTVFAGSPLNSPDGIDLAYDGTNWYAFVCQPGGNNIIRFFVGSSIDNPLTSPTILNVQNLSLNAPWDIEVIEDGTYWYALVNGGASNRLYRLDLDSLNNDSPFGVDLNISGLNSPFHSTMAKDGNNYVYLVANNSGNSISVVTFVDSLSNALPTVTSFALNAPVSAGGPRAIAVAKDCDIWYGLVSFDSDGTIQRVDFGDSLAQAPLSVSTLDTISYAGTREIKLVNENSKWYAIIMNAGGDALGRLSIGTDLSSSTTSFTDFGSLGSFNFDVEFTLEKEGSEYYGFTSGYFSNTIKKFVFPDSCYANISVSNAVNPTGITYSNGGYQYISLTATDASGNIDFISDSVYIKPSPAAGFITSAACLNTIVNFYDTTIFNGGNIIGWQWNFGDQIGTSNLQNPTYIYNNDSSYLVTLTVIGDNGCSSTFSDSIHIHNLPDANFSFPNNQCSRTPILFTDTSIPPAGDSITSWEWNFGDNTPIDINQNPNHSFDTSGTFNVQLIVYGSTGCSDTITYLINILSRPLADFTVSQTCIGETTIFTNTTTGGGASVFYNWDFGDGNDTTLMSPTHNYPAVSLTYSVTLIDSSSNGCMDTIVKNVKISTPANPGFIFNPANACEGNTVQFIDTSTIAAGDTIAYSTWDFGDNTPFQTGDTVTHVYGSSGTYIVTLTVTALTACDTSISFVIQVLESPVANFSFTDVCLNTPMYFYDSSSTPVGTTIDSILWDFGDLTSAIGDSVIHGYAAPGTYNVIHTVINDHGCSGTITQQVNVYELPDAQFSYSSACTGNAINFTNSSTVQNDSITGYHWDFGDGDTSIVENPVHIYNNPASYTVSLIVTSSHGCQAMVTQTVTVLQSPSFTFTASLFCLGDSTHFTYVQLNSVPAYQWQWDFGDSGSSILQNPGHPYSTAGIFNVTLTGTALNQCSNTVSQFVTINPKPAAGIISDTIACMGTTMTFDDNSTISSGAINQWFWNFGDGTAIETTQNTSHLYGNDTTYIVVHTVISDGGCSDSVISIVEIAPSPVANFTPNPNFGSPPLLVQFNNTTTGATSYQWTFGDGGTDIVFSPSHSYIDTGYYQVMLIATNSYNCSDTAYDYVSVLIPYLDLAVKEIHATQLNDLLSLSSKLVNLGNIPIYKFQISAKIENGSPINEQWASSSPLKPGEDTLYTFTARYEIDPLNVPAFYCIEISEINDTTDAVESNNKKCAAIGDLFELFDIYPNPTNDQINIGMNVPLDGTIDMSIYNAAGQLMKLNVEIPVKKGYNEFKYSIRHFAKGVYAFTVKYRDDISVKKIAKK